MQVFIVTKNYQPVHATFDEREAHDLYQRVIGGGAFHQASVVVVPTTEYDRHVVVEAYQAA